MYFTFLFQATLSDTTLENFIPTVFDCMIGFGHINVPKPCSFRLLISKRYLHLILGNSTRFLSNVRVNGVGTTYSKQIAINFILYAKDIITRPKRYTIFYNHSSYILLLLYRNINQVIHFV